MMPKKKRIALKAISVILIVLVIFFVFSFMYIKSDGFKSNEELFTKFFMQNMEYIDILKMENDLEIEYILNSNKYISDTNVSVEYTENLNTSNENKDSAINDVSLKIHSNVDNTNKYEYRDILVGSNRDELIKLEYLKENQDAGIRLNGIRQFVVMDEESDNILKLQNIKMPYLDALLSFSDKEKQTIYENYLKIIKENISKDKYHKQENTLITVNNKDIKSNAYYIKLTADEYSNLIIKLLEETEQNEVILSKIDILEGEIEKINQDYEENESLKEKFIEKIDDKIEEIKNNIEIQEVKISVYESENNTVRTSIEQGINKLTIDLYTKNSLKISNTEIGDITKEEYLIIDKNTNNGSLDINVEYCKKTDDDIINNIKLNYSNELSDSEITKKIILDIVNEKYEGVLSIDDNIEIVDEFDNEITLESEAIRLKQLSEEQSEQVKKIFNDNLEQQILDFNEKVGLEEYLKMIQNLGILTKTNIDFNTEIGVSEVEKNRFNAKFEFFASEDLTSDNVKELIDVSKDDFSNLKILLKNGEIQDLDIERIEENSSSSEYVNDIAEIIFVIKEETTNKEKIEDALTFVEKNKELKYDVSIQYNSNGFAELIRVKIK